MLCTPAFQSATHEDSIELLERAFASSDATTLLEKTLDVDVRNYLADDLLVKVDIATMAHGLEGRSPFLDHRLMEFAATLSPSYKLRGTQKKYLPRRLAERRLPSELLKLPKKGFGVPIDYWFRHELRDFTRDVLLDARAGSRGYFDMTFVAQMLDEHVSGRARWHYQLWNLLMLELWHRMYIDARPTAPPPRLAISEEDSELLAGATA
jgi:asparagine synthase (glutamine-hydrolysing)